MSSTIDLDFQDYAPTRSAAGTNPDQQQQQPEVQILIPSQSSLPGSSAQGNINKTKQGGSQKSSVLSVLQNLGAGLNTSDGSGGGLSEEALQQLIWLSNKQRSKQQRDSKNLGGNWGLSLLAEYFDVTTNDVIQRIVWSFIPIRKEGLDLDEFQESDLTQPLTSELLNNPPSEANDSRLSDKFGGRQKRLSYMERFIQSRPDFYGPFWVSTTLIFAIGIFSNIISSIKFQSKLEEINHIRESLAPLNGTLDQDKSSIVAEALGQAEQWHYSMRELNTAASLISFYVTLWPSFLWFLFWLRGCSKYYTLTETICAYGYSLSIFIPLSALLVVQASAFRFLMIGIAATLSGSVLVLSFLPMVNGIGNPNSGGPQRLILVLVFACQFGLAYILHRIMLQ